MQAVNNEFRGESLAFVRRAIIRIVLADLLHNESGNMALQHLGILWIIYEYSDSEKPITTAQLQKLTNVHGTTIIKYCTKLEQLGLVKKLKITGSHGKGRAYAYAPGLPEDLLSQAVKQLIENALPFVKTDAIALALGTETDDEIKDVPAAKAAGDAPPRRRRGPRKRKPD